MNASSEIQLPFEFSFDSFSTCVFIRRQPLCRTWSSASPRSFNHVWAQLSIQYVGEDERWRAILPWWDWIDLLTSGLSWPCRKQCPHSAGLCQAHAFSLLLSPQTSGFKEARLEYKVYKAWACIHLTALLLSSEHGVGLK